MGALHLVLLVSAARWVDLGPDARIRAGRAILAALLAAFPAGSVIGLDADHQGARLVYLPLAVLAAGLAPALDLRRQGGAATLAVLALWVSAAWVNAGSWRAASLVVDAANDEVVSRSASLPAGSVVFVDAPDSIAGAFAFRNGLSAGAELSGLRNDISLVLGQPSLLGQRRLLGRKAFSWLSRTAPLPIGPNALAPC